MEECDSTFTRLDVMNRHYLIHAADTKRYPCPHCKKYKGKYGFKRKDHLTQHLRGYHHIGVDDVKSEGRSCPRRDCPEYRGDVRTDGSRKYVWDLSASRIVLSVLPDDHAFAKSSEWAKHMRTVHNETLFPCPVSGCNRVGAKGWFRGRDMVKHIEKTHPEHTWNQDNE